MTGTESVDVCVIGAGVIGLAIAREIARTGREVLVLERSDRSGEGVSSRNSEVIHAGIYYPKGSLKAALCVHGKSLLYEYCESRNIGHQRIGKLIVATSPDEEKQLADIRNRAAANGVSDLIEVAGKQLTEMEPGISATRALYSPSTGIISAPGLMTAMLADLEAASGTLATHAQVLSVECAGAGFIVNCDIAGDTYSFACTRLVNAAGLQAQAVASTIDGLLAEHIPPLYLCKGNYFTYQGRSPFNHLIYPVPEQGGAGLGVHATIDLGGQVKFGPDVEYIASEHYAVSEARLQQGVQAIRRYFPGLDSDRLVAGYAGIRPKLQGPGDPFADFVIQSSDQHGVKGLINLFGIESPGLTSSMAIAETVAAQSDLS